MRTTVVGSYPRVGPTPEDQRLRRAVARWERGALSDGELRAVEVDVLQEVVREQASRGVDLVTDGQVTWYDALSHFAGKLDGFAIGGLLRYFDTNTYYRQPRRTGPVRWIAPLTVDDWTAAAAAGPAPVKAVLTGPYTLAALSADGAEGAFVLELASALGREVDALVRAGARHIQINEPAFTRSRTFPARYAEAADALLDGAGGAETSLVTFFGGVSPILDDLLALPFDVLGLDLIEGRNTLEALRRRDLSRGIALGVIDARSTRRDDPRAAAAVVTSLADRVPLDRSYVCPSNGLEFLPRGKAREKLATLSTVAKLVTEGVQ